MLKKRAVVALVENREVTFDVTVSSVWKGVAKVEGRSESFNAKTGWEIDHGDKPVYLLSAKEAERRIKAGLLTKKGA